MRKELREKFEANFAKVINMAHRKVEFMYAPEVELQNRIMVNGVDLKHAFHFAIRYSNGKNECYLAFHYIKRDSLLSLSECKQWIEVITKYLGLNICVCLVTNKGYTTDALNYVCNTNFDKKRLILAKFCGDDEQSVVLNRLWTNYADKRGRTGVLTSSDPCSGTILWMNHESYNIVGILSQLGIPIQTEYQFNCPYMPDDKIEEITIQVLKKHIDFKDFCAEPDFLYRIAENEGIEVKLIEMGEEIYGEYSCAEKIIYLNNYYHCPTCSHRERFTLAHEFGHHFLHRVILEQYNFKAIDDQESLNVIGARNDHLRYFEYQANKFASFLLMPEKLFVGCAQKVMKTMDIHKGYVYDDYQYSHSEGYFNHNTALDFVNRIAKHFNVSKEAARYRLKGLNLLRENYEPKNIRDWTRTEIYL